MSDTPEHILSLSYGKDSLACLGAIEQLGWTLDRIEWRCPDGYEGLYLVSNFGHNGLYDWLKRECAENGQS